MASQKQNPAPAAKYFEKVDSAGHLAKVSRRFGKMREVTLKKYDGDRLWIHISDNSKCFNVDTKVFDISKSITFSCAYEEALELKEIIDDLERYETIMNGQTMMGDAEVFSDENEPPAPVKKQREQQQQPQKRPWGLARASVGKRVLQEKH